MYNWVQMGAARLTLDPEYYARQDRDMVKTKKTESQLFQFFFSTFFFILFFWIMKKPNKKCHQTSCDKI